MQADEAEVYGDRVLDLLQRAKRTVCEKYEVTLDSPVVVEIFPEQKDFAVRTFGIPGGAGFLGVCFGRVITANSPASQGASPSNWEAVLWHEFTHVVTLTKTRNKMPRWLSEGISVYEEKQENPTWGQSMNPRYRELILNGELTPVSKLSGAFLNPRSSMHLQFAYYESSLVVEFLVGRHQEIALRRILTDLADNVPINETLERHTGSLPQFEREFAEYARRLAENLAPGADWEKPDVPAAAKSPEWAKFNAEHPDNFIGLLQQGQAALAEKKWPEAVEPLKRAIELYPDYTGGDNAYAMLATAYREQGKAQEERKTLEGLARRDADAVETYLRLIELALEEKDWPAVRVNALRVLAVNPLLRAPHERLAQACEQLDDAQQAIASYRVSLSLDPIDPAQTHFALANLLLTSGDRQAARRHVLQALEEAPRFRAAHRLLLQLVRRQSENAIEAPPEEANP